MRANAEILMLAQRQNTQFEARIQIKIEVRLVAACAEV